MGSQPSNTPRRTPREDLARLTGTGCSDAALEECEGLVGMVLAALGVSGTIRPGGRPALLLEILKGVAKEGRKEALKRIRKIPHLQSRKEYSCRIAAAAELLELGDDETLEGVLEFRCSKGDERIELPDSSLDGKISYLVERAKRKGRMALLQTRAALWLGGTSYKTGKRWQSKSFEVFEDALKAYVASHRDELRTIATDYHEPATPSELQAASHVGTTPSVPQPNPIAINHPPQHTPRIIDPNLQKIVDEFSLAVRHRLQSLRGYHAKSDLLPVRWATAPQQYFDHWENIRGDGQADPIPLANKFDRIAEVFESIPSGRLVVLGQGGAGKTTLAVELALTLLSPERRSRDEPAPFIFNLTSWNPSQQRLTDWMVDQLIVSYPILKATTKGKGAHATQLVRGGYILPIFDGFDEIAANLRAVAIEKINSWRHCDGKFVVTSRPQEYLDAINKSHIRLSRAPVVALENLTLDDMGDYLRLSTPPAEQEDPGWTKWTPILENLGSARPDTHSKRLLDVLSIPLMVFLARSIYRHPLANPMELLDVNKFPNTATIEAHLLDEFVRVVYEQSPQDEELEEDPSQHKLKSYQPGDAQQWLGFLATFLVAQRTTDFAWWKDNTWIVDPLWRLISILAVGGFPALLVIMLATIGGKPEILRTVNEGWMVASGSCLIISVILILSSMSEPRVLSWRPGMRTEDRMPSYWGGIAFTGFFAGISTVVASIVSNWLIFWAGCLLLAILFLSSPPSLTDISTPRSLLRSDRTVAIIRGGIFGVCMSTVCIALWLIDGNTRMLQEGVPVIVSISCLLMLPAASVAWFIRRVGLAMSGRLPWRCMHFLDDAHKRGVLRQSGGAYQFRHALLQIRLATLYVNENKSRLDSVEDLESELTALQFKFGRLDAASAISELRDAIESHRHAKNKYRVARTWILLIDVLKGNGDTVEALRELRLLRESKMDKRFNLHYTSQRVFVELLLERGDLEEAWTEHWKLLSLLEKDRRSRDSSTASRAEGFLSELRERPLFEYEEDDQD